MKKKLRITAVLLCLILISAVLLAGCGEEAAVTTAATGPAETTGQEDWGVSFAVEDATSTGLTLVCTQSGGGHQLGVLTLESYTLYSFESDDLVDNKEGFVGNAIQGENGAVTVECNATGRVALDWSETVGTLPSGKYAIIVTVLDVFDTETIQPAGEKQYHQDHTVEFTIP